MRLNLPNSLTLLRIILIPVLGLVFLLPHPWSNWLAAGIFGLAGFTDWLDGYLARRLGQTSAFGAFPNLRMIASTARHVDDADRHRIAARIDTPEGAAQTEEVVVAGIVDRIGAGDSFAAGILHGVRTGRDLDWTVRSGLALTCLKHSLPGDFSLFSVRDIEAFMAGGLDVRR